MNYVNIELDKPRRLKFDYNAICEAEDKAGMGIIDMMKEENFGFRSIRALMYAGLRWEQRNLTVEMAGQLLQSYIAKEGTMAEIAGIITEAIFASGLFGRQKEETEGNAEGTVQ
jgi:hypothetical protein